jgi:hypothetical protein
VAKKLGRITVDANAITALLHNMTQVNPSTCSGARTPDHFRRDTQRLKSLDPSQSPAYRWTQPRILYRKLGHNPHEAHRTHQPHVPSKTHPAQTKNLNNLKPPKMTQHNYLSDFRHISLLNNNYNLLDRFLAQRLNPDLPDLLWTAQYCCVSENTIFDALAGIHDLLALCEDKGKPICLLTLELKQAFDRIPHHYKVTILRQYGITNWFADRLQELYTQAQALVQYNCSLAYTIEIRSGVGQGCSISMILYSLCLHPLLRFLEKTMHGFPIGHHVYSPVIDDGDDVMVFALNPEYFKTISRATRQYEMA